MEEILQKPNLKIGEVSFFFNLKVNFNILLRVPNNLTSDSIFEIFSQQMLTKCGKMLTFGRISKNQSISTFGMIYGTQIEKK